MILGERLRALLCVLMLLPALPCSAVLAQAGAVRMVPNVFAARKGIGLIAFVGVKRRIAVEGEGILYSPEWTFCSSERAAKLRNSGIDLVRLVVNPLPLMNAEAGLRSVAIDTVLTCTDRLVEHGIGVVVDVQFWSPDVSRNQFDTLTNPDRYLDLRKGIRELAQALARRPQDTVALEPFNEPPCTLDGTENDWTKLQVPLISEVRKVAPTLPLIVTGCGGRLDEMKKLSNPQFFKDDKIIFTFHFYEPFIFTHQYVWGETKVDNLQYPPQRDGREETIRVALGKIAATNLPLDKKAQISNDVRKYISSNYSAADIDRRFAEAADWARKYRLPPSRIYVGEFGANIGFRATDGSLEARVSEIRWITDVRIAAERQGFLFSYWNFPRDSAYAFDPKSDFLKPEYVEALGLERLP